MQLEKHLLTEKHIIGHNIIKYECKKCYSNFSKKKLLNQHVTECPRKNLKKLFDADDVEIMNKEKNESKNKEEELCIKTHEIENLKQEILEHKKKEIDRLEKEKIELDNEIKDLKNKNDHLNKRLYFEITKDISYEEMEEIEEKNIVIEKNEKDLEDKNNKKGKKTKYKKKQIPKAIRCLVWRTYCGKIFTANCFCCNDDLEYDDYVCGHVISEKNGGETTVKNLRPICSLCNTSMGARNMDEFIETYKLKE